ncbi:MAG: hypothetical protein F6K18_19675 [Okeania sp. SIO2C2]|uniref:hypothetical protein n=1 Tax=Okeania sp. SIO2C2 TaxID=2607787 RepID=UPI0013BDB08E|nr:hypothetical protein [Okeania sp. SIO2C2]NEP88878.1 hypothetical protein [Okeania sp. SIO2C2]
MNKPEYFLIEKQDKKEIYMTDNETFSNEQDSYTSPVNQHDNDRLEAIEYTLAELHYKNGLRVVFSYDEISNDYGLLQQGRIDECVPFSLDEYDTLLEAYLSMTPKDMPIPEELLEEETKREDSISTIKDRSTSPICVVANQVELPVISFASTSASQSCFSTYYSWWDWHDSATPGLAPKTYYASSFGGKKRYAQSYIANCTPSDWGSWLWARHRIYYKNASGNYKKHYDSKVKPGFWEAKTKGSIKRWRRVAYDDGWNSTPNNSDLKYTREGRFRN